MSETPRQLEEDDTPEPVAGERLAAARRARDISLRDIAKELHLDEPKVQALEDNRFEALGAPVFAKGYLRKYAELVGVSIEDVLTEYYQLNRTVGAPPLVGLRRPPPRAHALGRWVVIAMLVILAAGAAFWWFTRQSTGNVSARDQAALQRPAVSERTPAGRDDGQAAPVQPAAIETVPEPQPETAAAETGPGETVAEQEPAVDEVVAEEPEPPVEEPTVAAGQVELRLSFSGDCWTEVTDATGRRLFFNLGSAGRVVTVSGEAPLEVLLGARDNVSVAVDGQDYVIRNSELRGNNTARLSIGAR